MEGIWRSRRSDVYSTNGVACSSQPLASQAGIRILQSGGNAADAAVAMAAVLNLTEPCSTGIGGDCFALYYNAKTKTVSGLNATGRCPAALSLEKLQELGLAGSGQEELPRFSAHTVTVPGAAAGWVDTVETFGSKKLTMEQILTPAIELAEKGFPVAPIASFFWKRGEAQLRSGPHAAEMLVDGTHPPSAGEIFKNPNLAATFRELARNGKKGFYEGRIAEEIVKIVQEKGGLLSLSDLQTHVSTFDEPIHTTYRDIEVYELPPNGQGLTALIALNILEGIDFKDIKHGSAEYFHAMIEAVRLAFADTRYYIADPSKTKVPIQELLSKDYAAKRRQLIDLKKASVDVSTGSPFVSSETVYFCAQDSEGNACSFINSNYMGFGTGLIPKGCGFTLQNRGHNFSLDPNHPNCLAPGKRPYHTIIPGMALDKDKNLWATFGVMGGFMQPQGHVQVLVNMIDYGLSPQRALDAPRFCIEPALSPAGKLLKNNIGIEDEVPEETIRKLKDMGHPIAVMSGYDRSLFGRGQIIRFNPKTSVMCAGSDSRADGFAACY